MVWAVINEEIKDAVAEFADSPSDRVCAIVGVAMIEETLRRSLELRLRASGLVERLFSPNRATGTYAAKVDLGYLLGMYEKEVHGTLEKMGAIRNAFAHRLSIKSFDHAALRDNWSTLTLHTAYKRYPHPFHAGESIEVEPCTTKRECFIINARIIMVLLMRDMRLHSPNSNLPQPLPAAPNQ
jgi:hypothetical protein